MALGSIYSEFTAKLQKLYGDFDDEAKRFEKASNSDISRELGYSDAQFSRLINETATEGEYQRAIQNTERILRINHLEAKLGRSAKHTRWFSSPVWLALFLVTIVSVAYLVFFSNQEQQEELPRDHTIQWAFNSNFVNPYVNLDDLPEDCEFPCYKYQGEWILDEHYKLPFFMETAGFHYLATEVRMYARCMIENSPSGEMLEGFEYQKHEIWYDKNELPLNSFLIEGSDFQLDEEYLSLDFNQSEQYVKVAEVHTFFRNQFKLDSAIIERTGKVIGRDFEFIPTEELIAQGIELEKAQMIFEGLTNISTDRLRDFSNPIECNLTSPPQEDFHQVSEGDMMVFDCRLTTSRVGLKYSKNYKLVNQYIKNTCR